jgi:hypothetical protein
MRRAAPPPDAESESPSSSGIDRIVALALAVMIVVLVIVFVDRVQTERPPPQPAFDFVNPMLAATPSDCVEQTGDDGSDARLFVRAPGVVKRPYRTPVKLAGWVSTRWPDPKGFLPYLLCEARSAPSANARTQPAGAPPGRDEILVFPLNGFGLEIHALGVLNDIQPMAINDGTGRRHQGYAVGIRRFDALGGPWILYLAQDMPVLGTMMRKYLPEGRDPQRWVFRVPETCR